MPSKRPDSRKLSQDPVLTLECLEAKPLGAYGVSKFGGNPEEITEKSSYTDLWRYTVELRKPGGGA